MNKHEYDIGYSNLVTYYQAKDNSTRYDMWWDKLKALPARAFHKAVDRWIEESRFFPTLGQIKRMGYELRTPDEIRGGEDIAGKISEADTALGRDLFPLFQDYVDGKTSKEDWNGQMVYFADKHGLGHQMREAIRNEA